MICVYIYIYMWYRLICVYIYIYTLYFHIISTIRLYIHYMISIITPYCIYIVYIYNHISVYIYIYNMSVSSQEMLNHYQVTLRLNPSNRCAPSAASSQPPCCFWGWGIPAFQRDFIGFQDELGLVKEHFSSVSCFNASCYDPNDVSGNRKSTILMVFTRKDWDFGDLLVYGQGRFLTFKHLLKPLSKGCFGWLDP